jgi:hypothetical protein
MSFDGSAFILQIAERLVQEFEFSARAGPPGLIGAAKEHPARMQLEKLMPDGIGVGSGIVVDSYGEASKQQDIVIYEKLCPVFTVNGAAEATYYPVEGVIACGEVKSTVGRTELIDIFEKCASVKRLKRRSIVVDSALGMKPTVPYRKYGSALIIEGTEDQQYNQKSNYLDQLFAFAIFNKFSVSCSKSIDNIVKMVESFGRDFSPNFFASLKDGFILPFNSKKGSFEKACFEADSLVFSGQSDRSFAKLLSMLRGYVRHGRTVDAAHFERYFNPGLGNNPQIRADLRVQL